MDTITPIFGERTIIDEWMALVRSVRDEFPGLETEESLDDHRRTVLRFMDKRQALCVMRDGAIAGVILFSRNKNMICFLAVDKRYRRMGTGRALLKSALEQLDHCRDITVSTFREDDPKSPAPRALYRSFGFVEGELTMELGYPVQRFVLMGG